jgi:hypothetical protein
MACSDRFGHQVDKIDPIIVKKKAWNRRAVPAAAPEEVPGLPV